MIESDFYRDYHGPMLTKATLNNVDILESIQEKYGDGNNWQGQIWTYEELFGRDSVGQHIYCEFEDKDKRLHWFRDYIQDISDNFHPPKAKLKEDSVEK